MEKSMTMSPMTLLLLSVMVVAAQADGWRNGAKNNNSATPYTSACIAGNFRPNNDDYMPQSTPPPFQILLSTQRNDGHYYPGEPVTVLIVGTNSSDFFEAYHIRGDCSKPVFSGNLTCNGGIVSNLCNELKNPNTRVDAVTNANNLMKNSVQCTWMPPSHSIGSVQFAATIMQTYATFWTGVLSDVLKPSPTVMTYENHQALVLKEKMAQFEMMKAKSMTHFQQMMANVQNQMRDGQMRGKSGNQFANMFGMQAAGKGTQQGQQGNPMMQMMSNLMTQRQNNMAAARQQQKWGGARFNSFMNQGEGQGGEAGENQGFTGFF